MKFCFEQKERSIWMAGGYTDNTVCLFGTKAQFQFCRSTVSVKTTVSKKGAHYILKVPYGKSKHGTAQTS